jgi:hypothetical protein
VIAAGFKPRGSNIFGATYESNHGDVRPSLFEGLIDDYIYNHCQIEHKHDVKLSDFVETERRFNIDFVLAEDWLIECAGMLTEEEFYSEHILEKAKESYKKEFKEKLLLLESCPKIKEKLLILFHQPRQKNVKEYIASKVGPFLRTIDPKHLNPPLEKQTVGKETTMSGKNRLYTDNDLIGLILKLRDELGIIPRFRDIRRPGYPTQVTYKKRRPWSEWLKLAGLQR